MMRGCSERIGDLCERDHEPGHDGNDSAEDLHRNVPS